LNATVQRSGIGTFSIIEQEHCKLKVFKVPTNFALSCTANRSHHWCFSCEVSALSNGCSLFETVVGVELLDAGSLVAKEIHVCWLAAAPPIGFSAEPARSPWGWLGGMAGCPDS
jgi:hypothetical protein